MSTETVKGKKIAILVTDGFEQSELLEPRKALDEAGAITKVVSPAEGKVKGWNSKDWGKEVPVDIALKGAKAAEFDALLLPGGVMNPDHLRMQPEAVNFVKQFVDAGKPIAAICHGPWTLIEAGALKVMLMTSWPSLRTDLTNAGATWVASKRSSATSNWSTSRKPTTSRLLTREIIQLAACECGLAATAKNSVETRQK